MNRSVPARVTARRSSICSLGEAQHSPTASIPSTWLNLPLPFPCFRHSQLHPPIPFQYRTHLGAALKSCKKKTKNDLKEDHDLFKQLETCDSPAAILALFLASQFDPSRTAGDDRLKTWFVPAINVLYAFSGTLSEGVALVNIHSSVGEHSLKSFTFARYYRLPKKNFAGVGVLLLVSCFVSSLVPRAGTSDVERSYEAIDVAASQDILVDIFGRIEGFFVWLEICTEVSLTPAMTKKGWKSRPRPRHPFDGHRGNGTEKIIQKVAGRTDLEDGLRKLDKLANEEVAMASVQLVKVTHNIDNNVSGIDDGVRGVNVKAQVVNDNFKAVGDRVQTIAEDGKATATEVKSTLRQTGDDVDIVEHSLRKWQTPPDPSTNHNIAGDRQHEGTAEWFSESNQFESWRVTGSLLWIHEKRTLFPLWLRLFGDLMDHTFRSGLWEERPMLRNHQQYHDPQARRNRLQSLLIQHFTRSNAFCDILSHVYETHDNGARQRSDKASNQCLREMLALPNQGPVFIIIDTLDECPDTSDVPSACEQVLDLVNNLVGLRPSNLYIAVTSRPKADICDALESLASQTVSLQDEGGQKDIASYVRFVVYSGWGIFMKKWRGEDKEHVIETLSERADGM
ncbi:hypothetical protein EDB83DRAFT_2582777 [Lactarius deliciosus]|nr:hypothetical protein EDB83DRAFT_2582777 [Lactarius deliciosus]